MAVVDDEELGAALAQVEVSIGELAQRATETYDEYMHRKQATLTRMFFELNQLAKREPVVVMALRVLEQLTKQGEARNTLSVDSETFDRFYAAALPSILDNRVAYNLSPHGVAAAAATQALEMLIIRKQVFNGTFGTESGSVRNDQPGSERIDSGEVRPSGKQGSSG